MRSTLQQPTQRIFALVSLSRSLIPALFAFVLALASFAVHAQQNPPSDPDTDPNPDVPREEPVVPVTMSASVSPTSIAAYTGTATLTWSSTNANSCEYDGSDRSVSSSETVGPYTSSGTKSLVVTCTGNGEGNFLETTVNLTVTRAPPPVITTDLSATVLEADVDTVTVEFSAQYADYCTYAGVEYPTSGEATLGPYAAGEHRLTFSCSGDGGVTPHTISWEAFDLVSITASVSPGSIPANDTGTVRVSWNAPAADDCSIGNTEYEKEDHEDFGPYSYSQAGSKSATVTCENRLDSASSTVTWEVEALDLPGAPRNLRFSENPSDDGSSVLRWDAPSSGATPTGYVVNLQGSSSNPLSKGFSSRRLSISGLSNGSYTYEVQACIGTATVPVCGGSDSITLDVDIPPGAPRNLRSSENPSTDGSFVLTWNAPLGTPAAAGYFVNLRGSTSGPLSKTFSARRLSISGLSNGSYTYEVQACSGTASEPNCGAAATVTVTVERVDPVPGAPRNLRSSEETSLDGSFDLSWDAPSGTPAATGYLVNLLGSTSGPLSKTYSARRLSISGLSNGSYTYEVQACTGTASAPNCGAAAAVTVTVNIPGTVTATAELDPDSIPVNSGTSVLTWGSTNATSCTLNGAALTGTGGTRTLGPYTTVGEQMFTVACTGTDDATASASATLNVVDPTGQEPTISITLSKTTVTANVDTVVVTWTSTNATACSRDDSPLQTSGTETVGPFAAGTHPITIVCTGTGGSASATKDIISEAAPPTVSASLSATVVKAHVTTVDLTWNSTGTTWCERDGAALSGTSGSETGFGPFYEGSHSFTVTCGRDTDTRTASATVTVRAATAVACSVYPTAPFRALRIAVGEHTHSVTGANVGTVFGDNPYTSDSPISKAAVHAGIVAVGESAIIRLTQENGQFSFSGTTRNGVTSRSLDSWRSQYTLEKVSDCGATAPSIPEAPVNLVSSENPSPDGSFSLSWDAPSGTGATPAGYLVYRSGSKSGYLSKTFADRTLSITGLSNGSYAYKVFACTGTVASPDCGPAANITVTVEIPDNDNDGIPDATDPDDDNDGMTDVWELENDLDDKDASDATQDADLDGHNNLAEFTAGSDPNWNLSYPGNIPEASDGFSSSYTVERGLIGGNDQLQDILIRNPTSDIVPAVSDFVLIQQSGGGFMIEDPSLHTIPSRLTAISSVIRLHDLNADGYTDMLLHSLDSNVQGASNDLIVFSNYSDPGTIPEDHVELSLKKTTFLEQVATWLDDEDYFDDNASVAAVVPEVVTDSISILADANGQALIGALSFTLNYQQLRPYGCYLPLHKCVKVVADYSDLAYDTGGLGLVHKPKNYDISIVDLLDDPNEPNYYGYFRVRFSPTLTYTVLNYSGFNERAILFTDFLSLSESLVREDILAIRISQGLEWALETAVFNGGLKSDTQGIFPVITENSTYEKVVREFFKILADVRRRVCFSGSSCDAESETDSPDMVMPESEEECYSTEEGCSRPLDVVPLPSQCSADLSSPGTITISRVGGGLLQLSSDPVSMPAVSYEAAVSGMNGECTVTSYAWSAQLSSEFIGKRARRDAEGNVVRDEDDNIVYEDKHHVFSSHNFAATTMPGPSNPANSWPILWNGVLSGGDLIVTVTANISFNGAEVGPVTAKTKTTITGKREALTSLMNQVTGTTVEDLAVAWTESRGHYHFDSSGSPVYGHPDGWGIMQLDSIPGFTKMEIHFWNWRANFQKGTEYIDTMYSDAVMYFNAHHEAPVEGVPDSGWGWDPADADSNPSVKNRIWDDAFSRYNSGHSMYRPNGHNGTKHCERESRYDRTDPETNEIIPDPFMNPAGCRYSTEVRGFIDGTPWDATD